ncbi:MAG: alpha-galactosidase [Eubacteriales bacterium]|nr:alpha-galactosidase [Eubacteriales bacterium]
MSISFKIKYSVKGESFTASSPETQHFSLKIKQERERLFVSICPKTDLQISEFTVKYPYDFELNDKIFVNGYQSWTDSLEYSIDSKMSELSPITEFFIKRPPVKTIGIGKSGDDLFHKFPRENGVFYGWSYSYVRRGNNIDLFGSLSERSGYTTITFDTNRSCVLIGKDLEGVTFSKETELLSLTVISGEYDDAFDEYFTQMGVICRENKRRNGYTTWYNYYGGITEKDVNRDLESISKLDTKIHCFQIDDGYQKAIGDWLITDTEKFPSGMKKIADDIHSKGMIAGLWLAPFAGVRKSKLFKEHSDWFIKDKNGKPYNTGHNWGGFYSLDIYNEGARDYIRHVFDVVLNEWGYDLVKLDFLYGACVLPMHNKTRGEIMCDAMDFIRECCGDKLILGCGVPLMPAFGKVDYCRIGSDISLDWKQKKYVHREDVSTPHAVCNTIFRRHLNGRAWMNDPDVFLLRDTNIKMTLKQRTLLAKINSTFGSLLFISDDTGEYSDKQREILCDTFADKDIKIKSAEFISDDVIMAEYTENGKDCVLKFNVKNGETLQAQEK